MVLKTLYCFAWQTVTFALTAGSVFGQMEQSDTVVKKAALGFSWNVGVRNMGIEARYNLLQNIEFMTATNLKRYNIVGVQGGARYFVGRRFKKGTFEGWSPILGVIYEYNFKSKPNLEAGGSHATFSIPAASYFVPQIGIIYKPKDYIYNDITEGYKAANFSLSFNITYSIPVQKTTNAVYLYGDRYPEWEADINKFIAGGWGGYFSLGIGFARKKNEKSEER